MSLDGSEKYKSMFSKLATVRPVEKAKECKGLIFRGYNTVFKRGKGHYEHQQGFRLLKRDSCPGCDNCGGLLEYADDAMCGYSDCLQDETIVDGDKYRLVAEGDGEFVFTRVGAGRYDKVCR